MALAETNTMSITMGRVAYILCTYDRGYPRVGSVLSLSQNRPIAVNILFESLFLVF